jgi:hypothetical protein
MNRTDDLRKSAEEYLSRSFANKLSLGHPQDGFSLTHHDMVELLVKFADETLAHYRPAP